MDNEFEQQLAQWEIDYGGTEKTTRMLQQLQDAQGMGIDTLTSLGTQTEQLTNIAKLSEEQENQVKGLGKYKKFNKYMKKWKKGEEPQPKPKEINHDVKRIQIKHKQDVKIFNRKQEEAQKTRELEDEQRRKQLDENNPFIKKTEKQLQEKQQQYTGTGSPPKTSSNYPISPSSPIMDGGSPVTKSTPYSPSYKKNESLEDEDSRFSKNGFSKIWKSDALSNEQKADISYSIDHYSKPITKQTNIDESIVDNQFIKRSKWIEIQDKQLDEMSDILGNLKNISIATHSELQIQSQKLDDIAISVEKGSDLSLKRKSQKSIDKERKKRDQEEKKRLEREEKTRKDIDKKLQGSSKK